MLLTDGQTDRQTDKPWRKHYLLGGGNDAYLTLSTFIKK